MNLEERLNAQQALAKLPPPDQDELSGFVVTSDLPTIGETERNQRICWPCMIREVNVIIKLSAK
jgi:hypothetical protein